MKKTIFQLLVNILNVFHYETLIDLWPKQQNAQLWSSTITYHWSRNVLVTTVRLVIYYDHGFDVQQLTLPELTF